MTIGERITQIRKEQGLSQEAFGDTLGVSRQSISKWEADQNIPDVDKLIAISKKYGVSVGWLLGTEEERSAAGELTDEQLRMVEKIAEKYLEALPPPEPAAKPSKWGKRIAVIAAIAVIGCGIGFSRSLTSIQDQQLSMRSSIYSLQNQVNGSLSGLTTQIETILKDQNSLFADYTASYGNMDYRAGTMEVTVSVTPKTYQPGMQVSFQVNDGKENHTVPGKESTDGDHSFSAVIPCNLTDAVAVSAVLQYNGVEQRQIIECWSYLLRDSLILDTVSSDDFGMRLWAMSLAELERDSSIESAVIFRNPGEDSTAESEDLSQNSEKDTAARAEKVVVRLYINGKLKKDIPFEPGIPEYCQGYDDCYGFHGTMSTDLLKDVQENDTVSIVTVVTDQYDRTYAIERSEYLYQGSKNDGTFDMNDIATTWELYDTEEWTEGLE